MEPGIVIREATENDVAPVQTMAEAATDGPGWPASAWGQFRMRGNGPAQAVLLIAGDVHGSVLGWAAGTALEGTAELEYLMVGAGHRGRGIGARLLTEWVAWAVARECNEVLLEVRVGNVRALRMYERAGFKEAGRRADYYHHPSEDALVLRLDLCAA